jgi:exopolyphosphatase/guanosine-5'-triphosphate,3'-diphosphate pyrophosphatase
MNSDAFARVIQALLLKHRADGTHARRVCTLALALFDQLAPLHRLGPCERGWLALAAWLHDLGWDQGSPGHHKRSAGYILADATLPLTPRARRIVACIARYHRKAEPRPGHRPYGQLARTDRRRVVVLGGVLRLADGLDCSHRGAVRRVRCRVTRANLELSGCGRCTPLEVREAQKKGAWLARTLGRKLRILQPNAGNLP